MAEVKKKKYPISPTMRWISQEAGQEGRLTGEGFRLMKAIAELVEAVTITDGEVTTEMLEAQIIRVSTLFADEVIITSKVAQRAITDITAGIQVSPVGPRDEDAVSVLVPVTGTGNTGVLINFTAFMDRPFNDSANFGYWGLVLKRNGVVIDSTPALFYDDNFAYPVVAAFVDLDPGTNPTYTLTTALYSGSGVFTMGGGLIGCSLLKR